ncbi:MAG: hypothetical protein ABR543_10380 [Gemmatimonadaceae bacterium]
MIGADMESPSRLLQQSPPSRSGAPTAATRAEIQERVDIAQERAEIARERADLAREQAMMRGQGREGVVIVPSRRPPRPDPIPEEALILGVTFFIMVAVIVIGLPLARAFARRLDRKGVTPALGPEVAAQIGRIEQAVDTMAIEVERISEAQRYIAKLQGERLGEPAVGNLPRGHA